jgi:hypothetical protein
MIKGDFKKELRKGVSVAENSNAADLTNLVLNDDLLLKYLKSRVRFKNVQKSQLKKSNQEKRVLQNLITEKMRPRPTTKNTLAVVDYSNKYSHTAKTPSGVLDRKLNLLIQAAKMFKARAVSQTRRTVLKKKKHKKTTSGRTNKLPPLLRQFKIVLKIGRRRYNVLKLPQQKQKVVLKSLRVKKIGILHFPASLRNWCRRRKALRKKRKKAASLKASLKQAAVQSGPSKDSKTSQGFRVINDGIQNYILGQSLFLKNKPVTPARLLNLLQSSLPENSLVGNDFKKFAILETLYPLFKIKLKPYNLRAWLFSFKKLNKVYNPEDLLEGLYQAQARTARSLQAKMVFFSNVRAWWRAKKKRYFRSLLKKLRQGRRIWKVRRRRKKKKLISLRYSKMLRAASSRICYSRHFRLKIANFYFFNLLKNRFKYCYWASRGRRLLPIATKRLMPLCFGAYNNGAGGLPFKSFVAFLRGASGLRRIPCYNFSNPEEALLGPCLYLKKIKTVKKVSLWSYILYLVNTECVKKFSRGKGYVKSLSRVRWVALEAFNNATTLKIQNVCRAHDLLIGFTKIPFLPLLGNKKLFLNSLDGYTGDSIYFDLESSLNDYLAKSSLTVFADLIDKTDEINLFEIYSTYFLVYLQNVVNSVAEKSFVTTVDLFNTAVLEDGVSSFENSWSPSVEGLKKYFSQLCCLRVFRGVFVYCYKIRVYKNRRIYSFFDFLANKKKSMLQIRWFIRALLVAYKWVWPSKWRRLKYRDRAKIKRNFYFWTTPKAWLVSGLNSPSTGRLRECLVVWKNLNYTKKFGRFKQRATTFGSTSWIAPHIWKTILAPDRALLLRGFSIKKCQIFLRKLLASFRRPGQTRLKKFMLTKQAFGHMLFDAVTKQKSTFAKHVKPNLWNYLLKKSKQLRKMLKIRKFRKIKIVKNKVWLYRIKIKRLRYKRKVLETNLVNKVFVSKNFESLSEPVKSCLFGKSSWVLPQQWILLSKHVRKKIARRGFKRLFKQQVLKARFCRRFMWKRHNYKLLQSAAYKNRMAILAKKENSLKEYKIKKYSLYFAVKNKTLQCSQKHDKIVTRLSLIFEDQNQLKNEKKQTYQ